MKNLSSTILLSTLLFGTPAIAGPSHSHDKGHGHSHRALSSDEVIKKAETKMKQLAESGKIDASWTALKAASAEQKTFAKGPEWVVTFKNDKAADATKQTLYLFFTPEGHYIAANFTGN